MKNRLFIALFTALLLNAPGAQAHDAHYLEAQPRVWHTHNGTLTGSYYLSKNQQVMIESTDGKIITVPLKQLSQADQQFVEEKLALIENINHIQGTEQQRKETEKSATLQSNNTFKNSQENVLNRSREAAYILLFLLILAVLIRWSPMLKPLRFATPILAAVILLTASSFTYKTVKKYGLSTRISFLDSAFGYYKPSISTRSDNNYYYVESLGLPDHEMMLGITAWQQQVPIPQCYVGSNAWSIPINPSIAATPVPVNQNHFLRGAVALAVNGIPIFNPYTNTGVDAFLDGQLDQYGGHSGRADDYHYHIAPTVLYNKIPKTSPVAFALDGFAIYGDVEPDGSAQKSLDANHGHYGTDGVYHYHSSAAAPYMIGNMVGTVTEDATMQIIPQAAAKGVRPALTPLKGATITHCHPYPTGNGFKLTYTLGTDKDTVDYSWTSNGDYTYKFITAAGTTTNNYKGQALCKVTVGTPNIANTQAYSFLDADNNIHLVLKSQPTEIIAVKIYASSGQLIKNQQLQSQYSIIPASGLTSGTYYMVLNQSHGKSTTLKITLP